MTTGVGHPFNSAPDFFNGSFHCYEFIEEIKDKRLNIWFWLEGVLLFAVGIIGVLFNIFAIIVLYQNPEKNTSFHILLI